MNTDVISDVIEIYNWRWSQSYLDRLRTGVQEACKDAPKADVVWCCHFFIKEFFQLKNAIHYYERTVEVFILFMTS